MFRISAAIGVWLFVSALLCAQEFYYLEDSTGTLQANIGEITVSASHNQYQLKEIPVAVSILPNKILEQNVIHSLEEVSALVPNFVMLNYGTKIMSPVYIRGIGSKKNSPSVGLYVDGIPYYENASLNFDFFDLERIEVLRGPQGTLFGRNTIAGLINIESLSPVRYQGTKMKFSAAGYDMYSANIAHYDKQGDFAYSLSGNYRYHGGYFTNAYSNKNVDEINSYAFRNRLIYNVNDKISIENSASLENSMQTGYPYSPFIDSIADFSEINYNNESGYNRFMFNNGLKFQYNSGEWETKATFAYQRIKDEQQIDQDFSANSLFFVEQDQFQNMLSAEVIAKSKSKPVYNWLFGAFTFNQSIDKNVDVYYWTDTSSTHKYYDQKVLSTGVFHRSVIEPVERFKITAGIRFNYEKTQLDYLYDRTANEVTANLIDTSYKVLEEYEILPSLALSYGIANSSIYAAYSSGYKPGGYNSSFEKEDQLRFNKETSHNFELGIKQELLNKKMLLDVAVFHSRLTGQQITRSLETRRGTYIDNTGKSRNRGVELSLAMHPVKGFAANLAYGYTHAKIKRYKKNDSVQFNGNTSPFIPKHTLSMIVAQSIKTNRLSFIDFMRVQANFQYIGESYWNVENELKNEPYSLLNLRLSFNYQFISFDVWAQNVMNTEYTTYMFKTSSWYGQKGRPRQAGATLALKF
jgi:iron complex outermembrane receptor protein